ncbi:MAG TPA: phosphosulfolactate synthase [Geobacterales bacterium]|nr:phosphosulfolactate synthase [Geobacterales bacterium]
MTRKAFDFLKIHELPPKPRKKAVVEIRGPYYTSVSLSYLKGLLEDWSEYFDGFKFAGGSQRLLNYDRVREIINLCHDYGVYVSTGGMIERVILQGEKAVEQYLEECKSLGFDVVEISSGFIDMPLDYKLSLVKEVQKRSMKAKPEISLMKGAGGGTHIIGYELELRALDDFFKEIEKFLASNVEMLMIESEGLTEDLPPEKWRLDVIKEMIAKFGYEKLMFEAADPPVFKWYIKNVGRDVNVFIDHSQIVEFNAWRLGLWGDRDLWKNLKLR